MAAEHPDSAPFWWFGAESAYALADRIAAARERGTFERLEVRIGAEPGRPMTFRVVERGDGVKADTQPDINDSFLCPPFC